MAGCLFTPGREGLFCPNAETWPTAVETTTEPTAAADCGDDSMVVVLASVTYPSYCDGGAPVHQSCGRIEAGERELSPKEMLEWVRKYADDEIASDASEDVVANRFCVSELGIRPSGAAAVGADTGAADAGAHTGAAPCDADTSHAASEPVAAELGAAAEESAQPEGLRHPVILHVYDLSYVSRIAGVPLFHFGVEVHGKEHSFGECGVTSCKPGANTHHIHREACRVGFTTMSRDEVAALRKSLKARWRGYMYSPLMKNCQHFAGSLCEALGVAEGHACIPERFCKLPAPTSTIAQASDALFGIFSSMPVCGHLGPGSARCWCSTGLDSGSDIQEVAVNAVPVAELVRVGSAEQAPVLVAV